MLCRRAGVVEALPVAKKKSYLTDDGSGLHVDVDVDVDVDVNVPWSCCQAGVELVAQQRAIRIGLVLTDSALLHMNRRLDTYVYYITHSSNIS